MKRKNMIAVTTSLDEHARDVLDQIAAHKGITVSAVMREFILDGLRRQPEPPLPFHVPHSLSVNSDPAPAEESQP